MKKLALVALISSVTLLTACAKPVTEVKKGESQATAAQVKSTQLTTNNKADIEADLATIQVFGMSQEQKVAPLQQRMDAAIQSKDQAALKALFNEFKTFVDQSNNELSALKLKSTEVNQLRGKMIESSLLGIEMSQIVVSGPMEQVDQTRLQPLQAKVVQTQQELMAISQDIESKIKPQPTASTPPTSAPEVAKAIITNLFSIHQDLSHMTTLTQIALNKIDGSTTTLDAYQGKVLLVVNVASKCGLTPQYEGLEQLYKTKQSQGLEILGFPANNFLEQEPGTDEEIQQFCSVTYDVTFPLFAKISVAGEDKHPLYQGLIAAQPERIGEGPWWKDLVEYGLTPNPKPEVLWNFEKFLINKQGEVVARFAPDITADDPRLVDAIEAELAR